MTCGLLVALCTALFSCTRDDGTDPQALYVTFRLALPEASDGTVVSKSGVPYNPNDGSWGDSYESSEAIGFEDKILKDQFHVTFYNADETGEYAGWLENIVCTDFTSSGTDRLYEFHAELKLAGNMDVEQLRKTKMKMMVVANMEVDDALLKAPLSTDNGLGNLKYRYIGQSSEDGFPAIPMWGVCSPDLGTIEPGVTSDLGDVYLLRAMAKIEVCVDRGNESLSDVNVTKVTVSKANCSGFGLPGNWKNVASTTDLKFSGTLRPDDSAAPIGERTFADVDNGSVIFYLPECRNGDSEDEIKMTVAYTVNGGEDELEGTIYLCPYNDSGYPVHSEQWDIVRNHYYQYTITAVGVLKFTTKVHEWYTEEKNIVM